MALVDEPLIELEGDVFLQKLVSLGGGWVRDGDLPAFSLPMLARNIFALTAWTYLVYDPVESGESA